jgi:hypothetical protein
MIAPLSKLARLQKISHFALVFSARLMPIALIAVGSSSIYLSVIAQTESGDSSDVFSEPIKSGDREEDESPIVPSNISIESRQDDSPQISDIVEVNPRSQQWETIHSGDLSRGTVKFRFDI